MRTDWRLNTKAPPATRGASRIESAFAVPSRGSLSPRRSRPKIGRIGRCQEIAEGSWP
jgi:hypothetical protein